MLCHLHDGIICGKTSCQADIGYDDAQVMKVFAVFLQTVFLTMHGVMCEAVRFSDAAAKTKFRLLFGSEPTSEQPR